ncbi:MAG TPA: ABC transporter ATP-binding protein [Acetobacteraceae bacterium]|jgi:peptide/nickel transport system ATP-binding protein
MSAPVLELRNLSVAYRIRGQAQPVLRGVSLRIDAGEAYGLVGESGCGKSTAALAIPRALPHNGLITGGQILVHGADVGGLDDAGLRALRSRGVAMVYQDPARALNPTLTIARQVSEAFETIGLRGAMARDAAEAMLAKLRIPGPARVMTAYPHQLSGGMQQRAVIAMALARNPALLVLDEPTTGLDVTVEAEILDLIAALRRDSDTAILFISHNLAVIGRICDRVGVLYAGKLIEEGPAAALLTRPMHPYTISLLRCLPTAGRRKQDGPLETIPGFLPSPGPTPPGCIFAPRCELADGLCRTTPPTLAQAGLHFAFCHHPDKAAAMRHEAEPAPAGMPVPARPETRPALQATRLSKSFRVDAGRLRAVSDVSFSLAQGETLGLVGESGSGKSTLARLLLGLTQPDPGGHIDIDGSLVKPHRSHAQRKALQIVFQNPDSALNRAYRVRTLIGRSLAQLTGLPRRQRLARLHALIDAVRLPTRVLAMRPRQLSGGLKQRVAIARAFAGAPDVVICDEPTSALDVSVQAAILNLLAELQSRENVGYIFISHDLGVLRYLADRIAVMYLGRIMEIGPADAVFDGPHHPYTEALLSAAPSLAANAAPRIRLHGDPPDPLKPPQGCLFQTRCPRKLGNICETREPDFTDTGGHAIRCHIPRQDLGRHLGG